MSGSIHKQMIIWTMGLVVVLGALIAVLMMQPPTGALESRPQPVASIDLRRERVPASSSPSSSTPTHKTSAPKPRGLAQAVEVRLPCLRGKPSAPQKTIFEANVKQVRLSGEACATGRAIASTEIRNETNGFSATVFAPTDRTFTSDYISLTSGTNRLRIVQIDKKGNREEHELIIDRQKE